MHDNPTHAQAQPPTEAQRDRDRVLRLLGRRDLTSPELAEAFTHRGWDDHTQALDELAATGEVVQSGHMRDDQAVWHVRRDGELDLSVGDPGAHQSWEGVEL